MLFTNEDCMEVMVRYPDKHFDLAIVDPPYGHSLTGGHEHSENGWKNHWGKAKKDWNRKKPDRGYFEELFRVSRNQVIWGGNYYIEYLKNSQCILVWDKMQREFSLADCEIAWTSFDEKARVFSMSRGECKNYKNIHPTQKPIALYKWLVLNYAKPGDLILDTHVGSASSLIAFEDMGFDYVGCELDADYYKAACERIEKYRQQPKLFDANIHIANKQKQDEENNLYNGVNND